MLLRDTDCMSMAHSLEVRVPFVDHKLVEFAVRIPPAIKMHHAIAKPVLIAAARDILPNEPLSRAKQCFEIPLDYWLRNTLREFVEQTLTQADCLEGVVESRALRAEWDSFCSGHNSYGRLWLFVALAGWLKSLPAILTNRHPG